MSEGKDKKVNCKNCTKRVPLGKHCMECGGKLDTESTDGGTVDGPRPPIQASDDTSSEFTTIASTQQNNGTSMNISEQSVATTSSSGTHQKDVSRDISTSVSMVNTSTASVPSYADTLKSLPPQQNQQSNLPSTEPGTQSLTGVNSEPSRDTHGQLNTSEKSSSSHYRYSATQINGNPQVCVYQRY